MKFRDGLREDKGGEKKRERIAEEKTRDERLWAEMMEREMERREGDEGGGTVGVHNYTLFHSTTIGSYGTPPGAIF